MILKTKSIRYDFTKNESDNEFALFKDLVLYLSKNMSRFITHEGDSGEATFDVTLLKKPLYKNGAIVHLEKPCS